jgi:mono/diheme cytochrome c family protein
MHFEANLEANVVKAGKKVTRLNRRKLMSLDGNRIKGLLAIAFSAFLLVAAPSGRADDASANLFKSKCAMCHGPDGSGKTMMGEKLKIPDLHSADVQKRSDADLKSIITKGKDKMPAYEAKLSKEQIDKLVAYIRDLAKAP